MQLFWAFLAAGGTFALTTWIFGTILYRDAIKRNADMEDVRSLAPILGAIAGILTMIVFFYVATAK